MRRRQFLLRAAASGVLPAAIGIGAWQLWPGQGLLNPSLALPMPESLTQHELVQAAKEGVDATKVWDMHVHLIGSGDSGGKAWANPAMYSLLQPFDYLHGAFYANAACLDYPISQRGSQLRRPFVDIAWQHAARRATGFTRRSNSQNCRCSRTVATSTPC